MLIRNLFLVSSLVVLAAAAPTRPDRSAERDIPDIDAGIAAAQNARTYDAAIQLFGHALARTDLTSADEATVYYNRGIVYLEKSDYGPALADFDATIGLDPALAGAYIGRGLAHEKTGATGPAIADYSNAIALDPADSTAYHDRAAVFQQNGQFDRAIADFDAALQLDPGDAYAYAERGHAYRATGRYDRALADFDAAIKLVPNEPYFYNSRAYLDFDTAHFATAEADFQRSLDLDPAQPYTSLWLGLTRAKLAGYNPASLPADNAAAWPMPIMRFYRGQLSAEAMMAAASAGDPAERPARACEALFFRGEYALLQRHQPEALQLLRQARASCPVTVAPYASASAELARLGG